MVCFRVASMLYSAKTEYGLRTVLWLARRWGSQAVSLSIIAREEHISKGFLEKIVSRLKKADILIASKGVRGGYVLSRSPREITLAEVMNAIDERAGKPYQCPVVTGGVECPHEPTCAVKHVWKHIADTLTTSMAKTTLADIVWK